MKFQWPLLLRKGHAAFAASLTPVTTPQGTIGLVRAVYGLAVTTTRQNRAFPPTLVPVYLTTSQISSRLVIETTPVEIVQAFKSSEN